MRDDPPPNLSVLVCDEFTTCPACGQPIRFGVSGSKVPTPGRVACCAGCKAVIVTTKEFLFRLPTAAERARIEATGLGESLREDALRYLAWSKTGVVPPKKGKRVREFLCD